MSISEIKVGNYIRDNRRRFNKDIGIVEDIDHSKGWPYKIKWIKLCKEALEHLGGEWISWMTGDFVEVISEDEAMKWMI